MSIESSLGVLFDRDLARLKRQLGAFPHDEARSDVSRNYDSGGQSNLMSALTEGFSI